MTSATQCKEASSRWSRVSGHRRTTSTLSLVVASLASLGCDRGPNHILMKRWDANDPTFKGKAFEFANFKETEHCAIVARHLNAAKESGEHVADFGTGSYRFECTTNR